MRFPCLFLIGAAAAFLFPASGTAATLQKIFSLTSPTIALGVTAPATGYVEQFDVATYGTLTQVSISYELGAELSNAIYNPNGGNSYTVALVLGGTMTVQMPSGTQVFSGPITHTTEEHMLPPHEGGTVNSHLSWGTLSYNYSSNLSAYEGTGNWAYTLNGVYSSVSLTPGGTPVEISDSTIYSTISSGTVTYTYTPAPEPSTYALIGLGLTALVIFRKRGKR